MHTKGWPRDVVKRRMEKEVGREAGQDLQLGLDPGEGVGGRGQVCKVIRGEIHYQGVKPIWRLLQTV